MRNKFAIIPLLWVTFMLFTPTSSFAKSVALSFDDLPCLEDLPIDRIIQINRKIAKTLKQNNIPSIGFVNEGKIHAKGETRPRIEVIRYWLNCGHDLGNHTYSHKNAKNLSFEEFKQEVIDGEVTIKSLLEAKGKFSKFFRYPYLSRGNNAELEKEFLENRGYAIAWVSIDPRDWEFNAQYRTARAEYGEGSQKMREIRKKFLQDLERKARAAFDRPSCEILLFHVCRLTSDSIADIISILRRCGYSFCPISQAVRSIEAHKSRNSR